MDSVKVELNEEYLYRALSANYAEHFMRNAAQCKADSVPYKFAKMAHNFFSLAALGQYKTFHMLFEEHIKFTSETFPEATPLSAIKHLRKEIDEVIDELADYNPVTRAVEYADCLGCLLDSAARAGVTPLDLLDAFDKKLAINKSRTWVKNEDNTYSHVKDSNERTV